MTQDKYDFMTCKEIIGSRNAHRDRIKALTDLTDRANASPGGFLVSGAAYASELANTRALLAAAERASQAKSCEPAKP